MERRCWDCGNVAEHEDSIVPHVLCKKCGSQDTRLTRTEERDRDLKQLNEQLCGFWKQLKALEMQISELLPDGTVVNAARSDDVSLIENLELPWSILDCRVLDDEIDVENCRGQRATHDLSVFISGLAAGLFVTR